MKFTLPNAIAGPLVGLGLADRVAGFDTIVGDAAPQYTIVQVSAVGSVIAFLETLMRIFALVLMFQRNNGTIDVGALLMICCYCTPCYLAYALSSPMGKQKIHF